MPVDQTAISTALRRAADLAETRWSPDPNGPGICSLLEEVSPDGWDGPGVVDLWDAVVTHLGEVLTTPWELAPGRTSAEVASMLRNAADR
ncbi:hypothetical protein ACUXZZ_45305 (plasmid) [Streptomyces graminifolii]|uniref:hypothetical protein n=1 Tax=Streptomyces graminifolii TaxID=1266771 RepID=UPI00405A1743